MNQIGVRVQEKGQVTIPRQIRKKLNLKRGDMVVFIETKEGIVVKPASIMTSDDERAELKAVVERIRNNFSNYSADEIESLVNDSISDVRKNRS